MACGRNILNHGNSVLAFKVTCAKNIKKYCKSIPLTYEKLPSR